MTTDELDELQKQIEANPETWYVRHFDGTDAGGWGDDEVTIQTDADPWANPYYPVAHVPVADPDECDREMELAEMLCALKNAAPELIAAARERDDYRAGAAAEAAEADRLRARVAELESWIAELRTHDASFIKAQARGYEAGVRAAIDAMEAAAVDSPDSVFFTVTAICPRILALLEPKP